MDGQTDSLIQRLIEQLRDTDPRARRNAAGALRLHGQRAAPAVSALDGLLADEDANVRAEARRALDRLRQSAA